MKVQLEDVELVLTGVTIVHGAALRLASGEVAGLIGPNGSGKSTLLRAVYRHLRPVAGAVLVGDEDVWRSHPRRAAQRTAAVPQERPTEVELNVVEMVGMGRTPHKRPFAADSAEDRAVVAEALERVGMTALAGRSFSTLSGGERQRVLVARALAQHSRVLVLDEPTNHLDVRHQLEILELVRSLRLTTLAAMHDLNLASAYCDRLHVIDAGRLVASGTPTEVLTEPLIRTVFGADADINLNPRTGKPQLSFYPLRGVPPDPEEHHSRARH